MTPTAKRITFWILFTVAAGFAYRKAWVKFDPLTNHPVLSVWWLEHNVTQLRSTHAPSAMRAWLELERLFLTKWSAYDWIVREVKQNIWKPDDPPIHFRVYANGGRFSAAASEQKGDCRTVNEALMAIVYQESTRRTGYHGDWRKWWDENWTYFPNRQLSALPSGPEAPVRRR